MNLIKTKMRIKKIARFSLKPLAPLIDKISPGNNFAIFHLGRCGSAVLGQLLKQSITLILLEALIGKLKKL